MDKSNIELKMGFTVEELLSEQSTATSSHEKQMAQTHAGSINVLNPNASLIFNGSHVIWLINGTPVRQWKAESGLTILNSKPSEWAKLIKRISHKPEDASKIKNGGPTPPGKYVLGNLQSRTGNTDAVRKLRAMWTVIKDGINGKWNKKTQMFQADTIYSRISWGNFRAPIIISKGTETFGRGSFYLHGGTIRGSHGCIDLTNYMEDFGKFYGTWLGATKKTSIPLVVDYGPDKNKRANGFWQVFSSKRTKDPKPQPVVKQPAAPASTKLLKIGASGPAVSNLQQKLNQLNYNAGVVDGKFGRNTYAALVKFQKDFGLSPDGVFGPLTARKLLGVANKREPLSAQPPMKNEFM